jgi:hypothetical protein
MTVSTTRLYAASIAVVSGVYAIASASIGLRDEPMLLEADRTLAGWVMLGIGAVVLVHGLILLTPAERAIGRASGPLMVLWAVIMLVQQWLVGMSAERSMMPMMDADPGMVAIAILMLVSGLIMIARPMSRETMP